MGLKRLLILVALGVILAGFLLSGIADSHTSTADADTTSNQIASSTSGVRDSHPNPTATITIMCLAGFMIVQM